MNIDVTSVVRNDQKLWKTPAAVYVITQEEIQRSGATTIPDLLRMAPGVQVAQVEPDRWPSASADLTVFIRTNSSS